MKSTCFALQWGLLWFSAPTNFHRKFVNNGTKVANFREIVNHAIELTCNIAFDGTHTPRALFLLRVIVFLCCAHDNDWDLKEEMHGWCVGEDRLATLSAIHEKAITCSDIYLKSLVAPQSPDFLLDRE